MHVHSATGVNPFLFAHGRDATVGKITGATRVPTGIMYGGLEEPFRKVYMARDGETVTGGQKKFLPRWIGNGYLSSNTRRKRADSAHQTS